MKNTKLVIFDTTLRDGEQCPGASMNLVEKLQVARQLEKLNVDIIEAGFPVISEGDFNAVQTIAKEIKKIKIAGLARCVPNDIDAAGEALNQQKKRARIHVYLGHQKFIENLNLERRKMKFYVFRLRG
jgi:2-isopropylmalate synthase